MFKEMKVKELLNVSEFVREPVNEVVNKIKKNDNKKTILTGGRGTGKSTIIHNFENLGIGNLEQLIYTRFDINNLVSNISSKNFNEEFLNHYYELILTTKILEYIKKYYGFTYQKYFKLDAKLISNQLEEINLYLQSINSNKINSIKYLKPGELSKNILEKSKNILNIEKIYLGIDRFDWINGNRELIQKVLSNFFYIFDKTIITVDDEKLNENDLLKQGYYLLNILYGKDPLIINEIIKRRIYQYNKNIKLGTNSKVFKENLITDDIIKSLIISSNGNISLILTILKEVINEYNHQNNNFDILNVFEKTITKEINSIKTLRKISKPPKLYL